MSTLGRELAARMFGADLDVALATEAADKATAHCQQTLVKDASRCRRATLQAYHRCKAKGLKDGSITGAAGLEACIGNDSKGRIAKACGANSGLAKDVTGKCAGVTLAQAFPACTTPGLYTCVKREVECMVCLAVDEADVLARDCDLENEVDQDGNTWCEPTGVRDGYAKLVITAKYAVRQAGSPTRIADSGMMGSSWAHMAFVDLVKQRQAIVQNGGTPPAALDDEILEVGSQFRTTIPVTDGGEVDWPVVDAALPGIEQIPSVINAREVIRLLNSEVVNPDLGEPAVDVFNFHHHDASGAVPSIVNYIRKVFAKGGEPLINNEMGLVKKSVIDKTLGAHHTEILNRTQFVPVTNLSLDGEIEQTGGVRALGFFGAMTRRREIATAELIKKLVIHFGNGVKTVAYFGFNGGTANDDYAQLAVAGQGGATQGQYFRLEDMNYSSVLSNDHLPVASNFRALLNLKDLLDSPVLSSTHSVAGRLERYELTLADKRVVAAWVPAYKADIGQTVQLNVAAEIAAGCSFYDLEGFDIVPDARNEVTIAMDPVFYACPF